MTSNKPVDRMIERSAFFQETMLYKEMRDIKNEMNSHFLSLENRLIKIEIMYEFFINEYKVKSKNLKSIEEFFLFLFFIVSMLFIFIFLHK